MEIASTGELILLGGFNVKKRWGVIVSENAKAVGNHEYGAFQNLLASNNKYAARYLVVQTSLNLLMVKGVKENKKYVAEIVKDLSKRGYKIDTSSSKKYLESINAAKRKALNLANKIGINRIQINTIINQSSDVAKSFDTLLAELNFRLGFVVPDTITLARYNEYNKVLAAKAKQNGRNKQR